MTVYYLIKFIHKKDTKKIIKKIWNCSEKIKINSSD